MIDVEGQAVGQKLLDQEMARELLVVHTDVFFVTVDAPASDVVLYLVGIGSIEWVSLRRQVVQAAAEGPDIDLGRKVVLLS